MQEKLTYHFAKDGYDSAIEDEKGKYHPKSKTPFGYTAYSRFFGSSQQVKYVVKQPKPAYWRGDKEELNDKELINKHRAHYEAELHKWNQIHPDHVAVLIVDSGIRLILPCLPGKPLTSVLYQFPSCLTEATERLAYAKIVLAVLKEIKRVHELGFYHGDFKCDNVLIEEGNNGLPRAYLIDCDGLFAMHTLEGTCPPEWLILEHLLDNLGVKSDDDKACLNYIHLNLIQVNTEPGKITDKELNSISQDLTRDGPTLIKVKHRVSGEHGYFVYGCLENGQWGFTALDREIIDAAEIMTFSGKLGTATAKKIVAYIEKQKGHVSLTLDLAIRRVQSTITDLERLSLPKYGFG